MSFTRETPSCMCRDTPAPASCYSATTSFGRETCCLSMVAVVNTHASRIVSGPDIHARGFVEDDSVFDPVRPLIISALEEALAEGVDDSYRLQQVIRRRLGRWVSDTHRRRPMIIPVVIE